MEVPLQTFVLVYAPLRTFFPEIPPYVLLYISCLQTIYFIYLGPTNNVFHYLSYYPPKKWSVPNNSQNSIVFASKCKKFLVLFYPAVNVHNLDNAFLFPDLMSVLKLLGRKTARQTLIRKHAIKTPSKMFDLLSFYPHMLSVFILHKMLSKTDKRSQLIWSWFSRTPYNFPFKVFSRAILPETQTSSEIQCLQVFII